MGTILAFVIKYGSSLLSVVKGLFGLGGSVPTAADQKVVDQNAALDASRRMNTAAAEPAGREVAEGSLKDGTF